MKRYEKKPPGPAGCAASRKISLGLLCLVLLIPGLWSCAGSSPGLSLGFGTHGGGIGLHSGFGEGYYPGYGHAWFGRHHSGVFLGLPIPGNDDSTPAPQREEPLPDDDTPL